LHTPEPLATSIKNSAAILGVLRAFLYEEIRRGHLQIVKAGTRSLVTFEELKRYLASRPSSHPARPRNS
jgi:excisionase family DNA binding protein